METKEQCIDSCKQLLEFYYSLLEEWPNETWIFRGQKKTKTDTLKPSLERAVESFGVASDKVLDIESGLIRKFRRQFHLYGLAIPHKNDTLEWLALMQHYGAPTRLLDWTYSFFVAVYFAIELADDDGSFVWALNVDWVHRASQARFPPNIKALLKRDKFLKKGATFDEIFRNSKAPNKLVYVVNPFRLNERIVMQQGCFLCPGDVATTLEDNLGALQSDAANGKPTLFKLRIQGNVQLRREILRHLQRMNMNRATLFPGLDGFAQTLRTLMPFEEIIAPKR